MATCFMNNCPRTGRRRLPYYDVTICDTCHSVTADGIGPATEITEPFFKRCLEIGLPIPKLRADGTLPQYPDMES
jgi:hypothetical protein